MSEHEQLRRQSRALLYAMALLHLLCLGLLNNPVPDTTPMDSQYAVRVVPGEQRG